MNRSLDYISKITTEYKMLTYSFGLTPFQDQLSFKNSVNFPKNIKASSEEYYHDDFGLYEGDEDSALSHIKYVIGELKKCERNKNKSRYNFLRQVLFVDYQYFTECSSIGSGKIHKNLLEQLTEICLYYGLWTEIYSYVEDMLPKTNREEYFPSSGTAPDFGRLYAKVGNVLLFQKHDVPMALEFYKLATADWRVSDNDSDSFHIDGEDEDDITVNSMLDEAEKQVLLDNLASCKRLWAGNTTGYTGFNCKAAAPYYNSLIAMEPSFSDDGKIIKYADNFFDAIEKYCKSTDIDINEARLLAIMENVLYERFLLTILFRLSFDSDDLHKNLKKDVLEKIAYLDDTNAALKNYAAEIALAKFTVLRYEKLFRLIKVSKYRDYILEELRIDGDGGKISYYCSLSTFEFMLPEKCKGEREDDCGKLSIMNLSYMNDPNEGHILEKLLFSDIPVTSPDDRIDARVPYAFIKCFTDKIDYLPMWQMYGDEGKGVCLVLDWKGEGALKESANKVPLYRVCYINKYTTQNGFNVSGKDNPDIDVKLINSVLHKLKSIFNRKDMRDAKENIELLGGISYLFKDNSYCYENEKRIMISYDTASKDFHHTNQYPPKLFVYSEKPVQLNEVILGPKVENIYDLVPYLEEEIDKMCEKTGKEIPMITYSRIDYK